MAVIRNIHPLDRFLRPERLPHMWCPGCGIGIALSAFLRAVNELEEEGKIDSRRIVFVTGIGCTARASGYVKFDAAHTPHGRAIPYAMGVKLANPDLIPVVFSGDGDIVGIGGNHFIHAARRNMDMLVIMVNNMIYALTGGQVAPTTPEKIYTTTTPWGNPERPFNAVTLAWIAGANYVARWSVTHPELLKNSIKKALLMEGFRFIEVLSICPEVYGRHIGFRSPVELYMHLRKVVKIRGKIRPLETEYDWERGITLGEFVVKDEPGFVRRLMEVVKGGEA